MNGKKWLDPTNEDTDALKELSRPSPNDMLEFHPVSKKMNNVENIGEDLIEPVES